MAVAVGFSPADRLAAIARHRGWTGLVLADEARQLYARLGVDRAPLWRVYSPGTLLTYARALLRGQHLDRPVEDTRQLGADAILVDGVVTVRWRPRSPDDRPPADEVVRRAPHELSAEDFAPGGRLERARRPGEPARRNEGTGPSGPDGDDPVR